jgi:cell filamentation protein, protein adenylyltransferase
LYEPKFSISHKILTNIGKIEAAKGVIDSAPIIPAWEKTFQTEAAVRTVHYGTHLEGNDLSLGQAKLIFEHVEEEDNQRKSAKKVADETGVVARDRDIQEILNYRKVLEYVDSLRQKTQRFTRYLETEIRKIHKLTIDQILPKEQSGKYRTSKVVVKDAATGEVSFRPPNPVEIPYQIEHLLEWINSFVSKDIHPILRAGIAHYELVRIHPFVDGNGRVARALATLVLFRENYDIKKLFSLEEHYDQNPIEYYQALQSVTVTGDLTQWLEYFTFGLSKELDKVKDKVKNLSMDSRMLNKLGQQISLTDRQIKLMEFMREHEQMLMKDAVKKLPMISEDTILREIKGLIDKELIEKIGRTKGSYYSLKTK